MRDCRTPGDVQPEHDDVSPAFEDNFCGNGIRINIELGGWRRVTLAKSGTTHQQNPVGRGQHTG